MFRFHLDQLRVSDNLFQALHTDFCEIFAHLLCQEGEVVHHILCATFEVLTQLGVLSCHTHRTGIGVTLAHHHTAQYNQWQCSKRELIGTQHRHDDDILGGLQLTIRLKAYLISQTVAY